jgi:hypothetical protein
MDYIVALLPVPTSSQRNGRVEGEYGKEGQRVAF